MEKKKKSLKLSCKAKLGEKSTDIVYVSGFNYAEELA